MSNTISIVISLIAVFFSCYTFYSSVKSERKKATIDAYIAIQPFLYALYQYSQDEIEEYVYDRTSEEYKAISSWIARIEIFATGIMNKTYDFRTAYDMSHGYIDGALESRINYIIELKTENHPELYKNTRAFLAKMKKKTK